MPNVAGNLGVHAVNLLATTLNDPVKADVILERIGANDVIVVRIGNTNRDTRCLVDTAGNGLEAYGNLDIPRGDRLKDGERETISQFAPMRSRITSAFTGSLRVVASKLTA